MAGKKGRSGRAIIPDDVKTAIGYRKDRINENRPAVVRVDFHRDALHETAQAFFDYHYSTLRDIGALSDTDAFAFNHLCRVFEQLCIAEDELNQSGQIITTMKGGSTSPALKNYLALSELYMKILREFGLTPVSRSSIMAGANRPIETTVAKTTKPKPGKGYAGKNLD